MRIPARIDDDGRAIPKSRYGFDEALKLRGKDVWITDRSYAMRTQSQNRYLWWLYEQIHQETGGDRASIHDGLKREALRQFILKPEEASIVDGEPTTRTDAETFEKYIEFVKDVAVHQLGVPLEDGE